MNIKLFIFINSIVFSMFVQLGLFGFNIDYFAYKRIPNTYFRLTEFSSGYISTLTIYDLFVGPFFVSMIIALSLGYFLMRLPPLFIKNNKSINLILIHFLLLLSWPIFIGSTNSFRQIIALAYILILLSLLLEDKKNLFLIIVVSFLVLFSHKFGKMNLLLIFSSFFVNKFRFSFKLKYIILIFLIFLFFSILKSFNFLDYSDNYITGYDLLNFFYAIFLICMFYLFFSKNLNQNDKFLSLFFICSVTATSVFAGNSLLYERVNWLNFIFSIFILSSMINFLTKIKDYLILISILFLLSITTLYVHWPNNLIFYKENIDL